MPSITHSKAPDLAQFASLAKASDTRILSKDGEVEKAAKLHRGHYYALFSKHVLRDNFDRYGHENIKAHLDFKEALKGAAPPEIAQQAFSLLSPAAYRKEPLTRQAILEVTTLLEELKLDTKSYAAIQQLFDTVSKDPRLQAHLEQQCPGTMDGFLKWLQHEVKEFASTTGVNAVISLLAPGIGSVIAAGRDLHKTAKECDHESHLKQVQKIGQLPGRTSRLAQVTADVLGRDHAIAAAKGATNATLGVTLTGIAGSFGVSGIAKIGVGTVTAKALPMVANKALTTAAPFATNLGASYAIGQDASDTIRDRQLSNVLPRLEVNNHMGSFSFSMLEPGPVRAMLAYLGPAADPDLLSPDAPAELREMEQARLALKVQLGSPADEDLVPGRHKENAPTRALEISHEVYQKLLDEDYNWLLSAVRTMDKGTGENLNEKLAYSTSLETANGTVHLEKSPHLTWEQRQALKETGSPSQLKLLYLAQGWL